MKTVFTITADTVDMSVWLKVSQNGKVKFARQYPTVTDAAQWLLDGMAKAMGEGK